MADTVRAQFYLSMSTADADRLDDLLNAVKPACVRLSVEESVTMALIGRCLDSCHRAEIPLLIASSDEVALAVARDSGADGVHLTGTPKAAPWVRRELDEDVIVGIDPGPLRHDAMIAAETGADYVSLSPDWPDGDSLPEEISWWAAMIETPMVIENATTPDRVRLLRNVAEFVVVNARDAVSMLPHLE